jgi:hypothetical protein
MYEIQMHEYIFYTENCNVRTKVTVITFQNGDHWHQYTFGSVELRRNSQIAMFEVIQQRMMQ